MATHTFQTNLILYKQGVGHPDAVTFYYPPPFYTVVLRRFFSSKNAFKIKTLSLCIIQIMGSIKNGAIRIF